MSTSNKPVKVANKKTVVEELTLNSTESKWSSDRIQLKTSRGYESTDEGYTLRKKVGAPFLGSSTWKTKNYERPEAILSGGTFPGVGSQVNGCPLARTVAPNVEKVVEKQIMKDNVKSSEGNLA